MESSPASVSEDSTVRLLHFSDLHLPVRRFGWRVRDSFSKRMAGWMNVRLLGRGYRFRYARTVLEALRRDFAERQPDHIVFSGDASLLAFDQEFAEVADLLGVHDASLPGGITIPGNHDTYLPKVVKLERFEHYFAPWLEGRRLDESHRYPFAQRVGPVWLIGLNSSMATFWMWDARGRVGAGQRQRLVELCQTLEPGPRILVTHYPLCMVSGQPEPIWHRLIDWEAMCETVRAAGICLWLCGHRHVGYVCEPDPNIPCHVSCAGSATQAGRWSYAEYTLRGSTLEVLRRMYNPKSHRYEDTDQTTYQLGCVGD